MTPVVMSQRSEDSYTSQMPHNPLHKGFRIDGVVWMSPLHYDMTSQRRKAFIYLNYSTLP